MRYLVTRTPLNHFEYRFLCRWNIPFKIDRRYIGERGIPLEGGGEVVSWNIYIIWKVLIEKSKVAQNSYDDQSVIWVLDSQLT